MKAISLFSNALCTLIFVGMACLCSLYLYPALWLNFDVRGLTGPEPSASEMMLVMGMVMAMICFPPVVGVATIGSWLLFFKGRYFSAILMGWLPLLNVATPLVLVCLFLLSLSLG